jgi:hypothetical protein
MEFPATGYLRRGLQASGRQTRNGVPRLELSPSVRAWGGSFTFGLTPDACRLKA